MSYFACVGTGSKSSVVTDGTRVYIDGVKLTQEELKLVTDSYTASEKGELPYAFYWGAAVVYHNEIYIVGSHKRPYTLSKWTGTSWVEVNTDDNPLSHGCAVVYKDEIHKFTGNTRKHLKWNGSSWTGLGNIPYDITNGSAVVYNNEIHLLGSSRTDNGGVTKYSKTHYKWDGTTWTKLSELPYEFYNGSAVVWNNEIHLLGSEKTTGMEHYKWDGTQWTSDVSLPVHFQNGDAVVLPDGIHILGGKLSSEAHYIWNGTSWKGSSAGITEADSSNKLNYQFCDGSAVVLNNNIHLLGGGNDMPNYNKKHVELDALYKKMEG